MYLTAETQARILRRFHFALKSAGLLFLGKAEMLLSHNDLFTPIDLTRRVFRKAATSTIADQASAAVAARSIPDGIGGLDQLRAEAFLANPVGQIVVTSDGMVALTNRQAEAQLGVSTRDVGRPFRDLELSYRPIELRRHIEQTQVERRPIRLTDIEYVRAPGSVTHLDIQIDPLIDSDSGLLGVTLTFQDVTEPRRLRDELQRTNAQLEAAYEELQSTNEELETTNEELQSTVEELETTNEELQSTNEELETMNQELQSTNDDLQRANDALRDSSRELDAANGFLEAVLTSLRAGVAVMHRDLQVQVWNLRAEDMWGLRRHEAVGQHFFNLDIGLPTDQLRPVIRKALNDGGQPAEIELAAVNRRGRRIQVRVACAPLSGEPEQAGAVLVMEEISAHMPGADG